MGGWVGAQNQILGNETFYKSLRNEAFRNMELENFHISRTAVSRVFSREVSTILRDIHAIADQPAIEEHQCHISR